VAVALAAGLLYARSVQFGWVFDDQMEVVLNTFIRSLNFIPALFTHTVWAGSGMETYLYRPLASLTYALNYQVSGLEPWSFHLVNILLHVGVTLLVFRLGLAWGLSTLASGLGALLFAVHPVHVEAVSAVFGRKDLLATLFLLAMMLWHRRALVDGGLRSGVPVIAFAMALLSKEVGMAGLGLVAAQDLIFAKDRRAVFRNPSLPRLYTGYLAVLVGYVLVRNALIGGLSIPATSYLDNPLVAADPPFRVLTALAVLGKGVVLQLIPYGLSPDYSYNAIPLVQSLVDVRLLTALGILGATAVLLIRFQDQRVLPMALAWYGLAILPASNLLITSGTIFGERLLYLPSLGLCLLAGSASAWMLARWRVGGGVVLLLVFASFSFQTLRYSSAWADDISLFRWAVASVPNSSKAHHKLGEELLRVGDLGGAVRSLNRALSIAPDNLFAAQTLGQARARLAREYLVPDSGGGIDPPPSDPDLLYLLGQISREEGNLDRAEAFWSETLALEPQHPEALGDLGVLHLSRGDTVRALPLLEEAVQFDPTLASVWYALARVHLARGETNQAMEALQAFVGSAGPRFPEQVRWARGVLAQWSRQ
jgi:tetratricopeptide (TPR) repeat protein